MQQKKARKLIKFLDINRRKNYTAYVILLMPFPSQKSSLPWSLACLNEPLSRWSNTSALLDLQSSKKVLNCTRPSPHDSLHQLLTLLFHKKFVDTHHSFLSVPVHKSSAQPVCTCPSAAQLLTYSVISNLGQMWTSPCFYPQEMAWIQKAQSHWLISKCFGNISF